MYDYLLKTGPMDVVIVQSIFTQLVGAVSYVHNMSCVHRDLKLENILLDKNENVKLVDFGFTREYEGKASYLQTWCGTVCYSAPEMIKGEKYAGEKVDVWSLGIILYALLCGELPFDDDDEVTTKTRIMKEEPHYPDSMPQPARDLVSALLSKRPLLRPSLADVLTNPWLVDHAPQQQAILKLKQSGAFTTELEKNTLLRMKSAGVDIDQVIENVLAQRCDPLAGWWALLLEKEERKDKKRQRKRKEREIEIKAQRRISAASSRLDFLASTITEHDEEGMGAINAASTLRQRGRPVQRRSGSYRQLSGSAGASRRSIDLSRSLPDLPKETELANSPPPMPSLPKADEDPNGSIEPTQEKPALPPKEARRRSSLLHVAAADPRILSPNGIPPKKQRKYQRPFLSQLASLKHWLMESAKRARSPYRKRDASASPKGSHVQEKKSDNAQDPSPEAANPTEQTQTPEEKVVAPPHDGSPSRRARISIATSPSPAPRISLSPSPIPLTPHLSYRRATGLRGRKSTSSSISSIHSIHQHHHTHSKTSSTSSTSASATSPAVSAAGRSRLSRSPHSGIKTLTATPTTSFFPNNIRVVRASPGSEGRAAFGALPSPTPGLVFARRKRTAFKGPMLTIGPGMSSYGPGRVGPGSAAAGGTGAGAGAGAGSRSVSVQGRQSGEIIEEEDEEEGDAEEEDVEIVDTFSPITGNDEVIELFGEHVGNSKVDAKTKMDGKGEGIVELR